MGEVSLSSKKETIFKKCVIAMILSFIAGLGQFYLGKRQRGIIWFIVTMVMLWMIWPLGMLAWASGMWDTWQLAHGRETPLTIFDRSHE